MSRRSLLPQSRKHLMLYDEDWEYLDSRFGQRSAHRVGTGVVIRNMIHLHVKALREKEEAKMEQLRQAKEARV